jgi:hypothetical protein
MVLSIINVVITHSQDKILLLLNRYYIRLQPLLLHSHHSVSLSFVIRSSLPYFMGCCSSSSTWKQEQIQDYQFVHIDVQEFVLKSAFYRFKYVLLYCTIMKDTLVYMADVYTVYQYNTSKTFERTPGLEKLKATPHMIEVLKWLYLGSIFFSLLLLMLETRKAFRIIQSSYISTAFTNNISYRQYAIQSFAHYSFFQRIEMCKRPIDKVAFYCYFSLKGKSSSFRPVFLSITQDR